MGVIELITRIPSPYDHDATMAAARDLYETVSRVVVEPARAMGMDALLVATESWQDDRPSVRHRLRGQPVVDVERLEGRAAVVGEFEDAHDGAFRRGVVLRVAEASLPAALEWVRSRRDAAVVLVGTRARNETQVARSLLVASLGWEGRRSPAVAWGDLIGAMCDLEGLVLRVWGRFDDPEVSVAAIGPAELIAVIHDAGMPRPGHTCLVCGFPALDFEPADDAFEICPCCSAQYGYTVRIGSGDPASEPGVLAWRRRWIEDGMVFWSDEDRPDGWDAERQLGGLLASKASSDDL
jgi:hypothetical protein